MKIVLIVMLALASGAAAAFAQTISAPPTKVPAGLSQVEEKKRAHVAAVADCRQMWDRGTHMSTQEWARACRRVQNRLRLLDVR